jgi:WXXGXW repeat (2 copies)
VVMEAPPALPIYDQPPCPYDGYHWIPGYWGWGGADYYWVPGTWAMPPRVGVFWTPGYWGFVAGGRYEFHGGYWGERVGFYGGINYGGGYFGSGFVGGRWEGSAYRYNAAVTNVTNVRNVYRETVINNVTINNVTRVSYSGGQGGARSERTEDERNVERLPHLPPTDLQLHHERDAVTNPALSVRQNQGRPPIAATPRPGAFSAPEATSARLPATAIPEESRRTEPAHPGFGRTVEEDRPRPEGMPSAAERPVPEARRPAMDDRPVEVVHATVPRPPAAAPGSSRSATPPHSVPRDTQRREREHPKPKPKPDSKHDDRDARDRPQ